MRVRVFLNCFQKPTSKKTSKVKTKTTKRLPQVDGASHLSDDEDDEEEPEGDPGMETIAEIKPLELPTKQEEEKLIKVAKGDAIDQVLKDF